MPTFHTKDDYNPTPVSLGTTRGYFGEMPVVLHLHDRRQHVALIGRSGVGKSTLLKNLFAHDVASGAGVALIDPHGDLARSCLELIPPARRHEVLYFNPADLAFPVGFNLLANVPPDSRPALVSRLVAMFRALFASSWGYRVERLLQNALAVLLDQGDATLLGLIRILDDEAWRGKAVSRCCDPLVQRYWLLEYPKLDDRLGGELDQPLRNKLGQIFGSPAIRNIVGQTRPTFNPRAFMDERKILIADLSKGLLGDTHAQMLGSLLVAAFEQAAMTRADIPEHARVDFHLLIDEHQNFVSETLPIMLAECRKYRLCLTLANQYLEQLTDNTRAAILGNVGSMIIFRVGAQDAPLLAREVQPLDPATLLELSVGKAWCRLLDHGQASSPTLVTLHDAPRPRHAVTDGELSTSALKVIGQSRERYASTRATIEAGINRFLALDAKQLPRFSQKALRMPTSHPRRR